MAADEFEALAQLPECGLYCPLGVEHGAPHRGVLTLAVRRRHRRQCVAKEGRHEVQDSDQQEQRRWTCDRDNDAAQERKAERKRRVERHREDPVCRDQLAARHDDRDHRRLGRREERRRNRDQRVEHVEQEQVIARQEDGPESHGTDQVGNDQHRPAIHPVHVDASEGREQHRRHEECQQQHADGGHRIRGLLDDDRQPEDDHVAADLGRGLRQPEQQEGAVLEDRQRAGLARCRGARGNWCLGYPLLGRELRDHNPA